MAMRLDFEQVIFLVFLYPYTSIKLHNIVLYFCIFLIYVYIQKYPINYVVNTLNIDYTHCRVYEYIYIYNIEHVISNNIQLIKIY